ncbi:M23/M56 family metallopeptidase [Massilia horti]|uniref:Uncharacterized protein n=1 Tax=Massilia horti TaxID=2562153 RepID=A0A4Y9SSS8_9BURK|nr:M23/M56 family metallopeptidase [Massilia horti]TFW29535.1 hypothetical protein E4O92_18485 [Massilia horti]
MNPLTPAILWTFCAACASSVLFAALVVATLTAARGRWPALAAHRSVWTMAQFAVATCLVVALLPGRGTSVLPTVQIAPLQHADASAVTMARAAPPPDGSAQPAGEAEEAAATAQDVLQALPLVFAGAYAIGLLWFAGRRFLSWKRWRGIRAAAEPVDTAMLHSSGVCTGSQAREIASAGLAVRTIDAPISPLLLGIWRPCLLLPRQMERFAPEQQRMIIEHELAHWRRRDGWWLLAANLLQLLFWFNPPFRKLVQGLQEAVELGCDDTVLAGRAQHERKAYAAALVAQFRLQHIGAAPAFGAFGVAERVARMRDAVPARLGITGRVTSGAGAVVLAFAAALLQPAFSSTAALPVAGPGLPQLAPMQAEPGTPIWGYPLDRLHVTSRYGVVSSAHPKGHRGVDFGARRGTPVHAVAPGRVIETGRDERYGIYLRVDHGEGRESMMAHLNRLDVREGEQVKSGQQVGAAGATGMATGPHVHLEYRRDGQLRDPQLLLPDLDPYTTVKALALHRAQFPSKPHQE